MKRVTAILGNVCLSVFATAACAGCGGAGAPGGGAGSGGEPGCASDADCGTGAVCSYLGECVVPRSGDFGAPDNAAEPGNDVAPEGGVSTDDDVTSGDDDASDDDTNDDTAGDTAGDGDAFDDDVAADDDTTIDDDAAEVDDDTAVNDDDADPVRDNGFPADDVEPEDGRPSAYNGAEYAAPPFEPMHDPADGFGATPPPARCEGDACPAAGSADDGGAFGGGTGGGGTGAPPGSGGSGGGAGGMPFPGGGGALAGSSCLADADCSAGEVCAGGFTMLGLPGACRTGCASPGAACANAGETCCSYGDAFTGSAQLICAAAYECSGGYAPTLPACEKECASDADCADGLSCAGSRCVVNSAPPLVACPGEPRPTVLYISADDSNSQSSAAILRNAINSGTLGASYGAGYYGYGAISAASIRTYEFLNYYDVRYAPLDEGLRVVAQLRPAGGAGKSYKLQIGVQAPALTPEARPPLNFVFSLDTSGSMSGRGVEMTQAVLTAMAHHLRPDDLISIVQWSNVQGILLDSYAVTGPDDAKLLGVITGLKTGGSTDLHSGLVTAYDLAYKNFDADRLNRVVLVSDGGANTGVTDIDIIAAAARAPEQDAIFMIGVGAGDYYNDALMDQVTDAGKGAAMYIDRADEAQWMFGDKFIENTMLAAIDVRVQLKLPPGWDVVEFHGEQISPDPGEVDPQHLAPNDAMIFNSVIASCDPGAASGADIVRVDASYTDIGSGERKQVAIERSFNEMLDAPAPQLIKGDAIVAYAEAAKALLGTTPQCQGENGLEVVPAVRDRCDELRTRVEFARKLMPDDWALAEVEELGKKMCDMFGAGVP